MSKLRQDLAYALRTFVKAPGFALIAILVIGGGIGANTAIFSIVNGLLFRSLSGRADELVGIHSRDRNRPDAYRGFSYPNFVDVRDRSEAFEAVLAHTFCIVGVPAGEETRRTFAAVVSSNYARGRIG
jgi:hypothetical protein